MLNPETYQPTPTDIDRAVAMMTPEQRLTSDERERFKFQDRDPFDDFLAQIDEHDERRIATAEERRKMDENMVKLAELFERSSVRWNLDGALNISLMRGEYIGVHKDVDVSVEAADLAKLDGVLLKKGYGLFLSVQTNEPGTQNVNVMERVGADRFAAAADDHLIVAAVDERGKIRDEVQLNFLDIHLVRRDAEGRALGPSGSVLPERWSVPIIKMMRGHELHLSHPAKVAFFKLHQSRSYDRTDLQKLVEQGSLTLGDMNDIEEACEQEFRNNRQSSTEILVRIIEKFGPEMNAKEIYDIFLADPMVARKLPDEAEKRKLFGLCEEIAKLKDRTPDAVIALVFSTFDIERYPNEIRRKITEMREWVVKGGKRE